jgi:hypothetical protein
MKALTEAGSLGGSKLNLKGTGWKTDGTSQSMDGDELHRYLRYKVKVA